MAQRPRKPREIFLSHSSRDQKHVSAIARTLRARGLKVWYSKAHLVGAQAWHDEIGRALKRCDWFVVLLSPSAVKSSWVKRELVFALSDSRYDDRIIPLIIRDCDPLKLSWALQAVQMIDLRRDGMDALLRIWGLAR